MEKCISTSSISRKPICFILHGFNVRDGGKKTTNKLEQIVRDMGYEPKLFEYGWLGLAGARFFSDNLARLLWKLSEPGDVAIGHSNGCNIINQALQYGANLHKVFYIAPALNHNTELARQTKESIVLYTKNDWIVRLASYIPFHPWGRMGYCGYTGTDSRYRNINCTNWSFGHSDYFHPNNLKRVTYFLRRYLHVEI